MSFWWIPLAFAGPEEAVRAELARAAGLRLQDAPPPYFVGYDLLEGRVSECLAENGATLRSNAARHREIRTEVRSGDRHEDSSNVAVFGGPSPVDVRLLPIEDHALSLRRELWLATDRAYKGSIEALSQKKSFRRGQPARSWDDFARVEPLRLPFAPGGTPEAEAGLCGLAERLSAVIGGAAESGTVVARDWQGQRYTATTEGTDAWRPTAYAVLRMEATTTLTDGSKVEDARSWVASSWAGMPPEAELHAAAEAMASWLAGQERAVAEADYLGPVIFEGQAAVELFSQLLASEVTGSPPPETDPDEGDFSLGGPPAARIGRRLLPEGWRVTDDTALRPGAAAAYVADHEGVRPRRVELVVDGVVKDLLMSRMPTRDRAASTGHGRSIAGARRVAVPAVVQVAAPRLVSAARLRRRAMQLAADTGRDHVLVVRQLTPPALFDDLDILITGEGPGAGLGDPYEILRVYADGRETPLRPMRFVGVDRRLLRDIVLASAGAGFVETLDGAPGPDRYQVGPTGGLPQAWDVPDVLVAEVELAARPPGEPRRIPVR